MLKKFLMFALAVSVLVSMAYSADLVKLNRDKARPGPVQQLDDLDELIIMSRMSDDQTEYYLGSGTLNDTMCQHYQPLAPCSLYYVDAQFNDATGPGGIEAYVWYYSDAASSMYSTGTAPERGQSTVSPLGAQIVGPYNFVTQSLGDWEPLITQDQIEAAGGIQIGDPASPDLPPAFVVGFVKTEELADNWPNPLADDCTARGFTYTWFGGPWMETYDNDWGSYSSDYTDTIVELAMQVAITYPWGVPPIISGMTQLPNTVNLEKECMVKARISDDTGMDNGDTAVLNVAVNGGDPTTYDMNDDDQDGVYEGTFNLGTLGAVVGDNLEYWIVATDEDGSENSNYGSRRSFSPIAFTNGGAAMLVVDDGMSYPGAVQTYLDENYTNYEWYSVGANKGIDEYAVNNGWSCVMLIGWGVSTVPTREYDETNAYVSFLEGGGDMIFIDQDYMYANGEEPAPFFGPGDYAYDFFGIVYGLNDPYTEEGEMADSVFYGEAGTIADAFTDDPYVIYPQILYNDTFRANWTDSVSPSGDAVTIFIGDQNGDDNAIMKGTDPETESVTMYFGFDPTWACDRDENQDPAEIPNQQFIDFFDTMIAYMDPYNADAPEAPGTLPQKFELSQNYPNPFNPTTKISFTVPNHESVQLKVYNTTGQEVATLYDGYVMPGHRQDVMFDATNLSSGVYFYTLSTPSHSETRKMILLK